VHTYIQAASYDFWTVGHYRLGPPFVAMTTSLPLPATTDVWVPMKDFKTEREAAAYVHYLNGGSSPFEGDQL
jgi:hypothetical protein